MDFPAHQSHLNKHDQFVPLWDQIQYPYQQNFAVYTSRYFCYIMIV